MSIHTPHGAIYTTDDLIRMAQMEYFGQYNAVVGRAFMKLKYLEAENKKLHEELAKLRQGQDPEGTVHTISER